MNMIQAIQQCQSGDIEAIEKIFQSYHPAMFRLAYSILLSRDEADEATQEAFIAAFNSIDTCQGELSFRNWLYTITLNICRGRLRKRKVLERLQRALESISFFTNEQFSPNQNTSLERKVIKKEGSERLWEAINQLDEKTRIPIVLYYYEDLPVAEIAITLHTTEQTIYSRLHKARIHLYKALQDDYPLLFRGAQDE